MTGIKLLEKTEIESTTQLKGTPIIMDNWNGAPTKEAFTFGVASLSGHIKKVNETNEKKLRSRHKANSFDK